MPTIEELIEQQNIQLTTLPQTFEAICTKIYMKIDKRNKDCLHMDITLKDGGTFTQKWSKGFYGELAKVLQAVNLHTTDDLIGKLCLWERRDYKIMDAKARWVPIKVLGKK